MGERTNIVWTDSTHNFWRGCTKVSPGCVNCYAETLVTTRLGGEWGKGKPRVRSKSFDEPLRWNKKPNVCGCCNEAFSTEAGFTHRHGSIIPAFHTRRVFSLSLGDWLDDEVPIEWLADMLDVIRRCPNLIFQLLTKRPENFTERLTAVMKHIENSSENHTSRGASLHLWALDWVVGQKVPSHIWIGASVENQPEADRRIPELLKIPAAVRFLSFEPLLEDIDFSRFTPWLPAHPQYNASECVQWVIVGGESGPHARPCNADWIRSVVSQCKDASVPCFVKQLGAKITVPHPQFGEWDNWHVKVKDRKGADPSEWPQDLQVRQFPEGAQ